MRNSGGVVGMDIGGTKIRVAVVEKGGKIGRNITVPTDTSKGASAVNKAIFAALKAVVSSKPRAIGVGVAGLVDHTNGVYRHGPNFPKAFRNVKLAAIIRKKYGVPTVIDNDVHCFTLAEATFGSVRRYSRVIGLTLGTGVGGALVENRVILRGRDNAAGEFGHMTIMAEDGEPCSCGQDGHFEAYASGTAMASMYEKTTGKKISAKEVEDMAAAGGAEARRIIARSSKMIAVGLASIVQTLNPDAVVIGGGVGKVDMVMRPAIAAVPSLIAFPELKKTPIVQATFGGDANVIGAAILTGKL